LVHCSDPPCTPFDESATKNVLCQQMVCVADHGRTLEEAEKSRKTRRQRPSGTTASDRTRSGSTEVPRGGFSRSSLRLFGFRLAALGPVLLHAHGHGFARFCRHATRTAAWEWCRGDLRRPRHRSRRRELGKSRLDGCDLCAQLAQASFGARPRVSAKSLIA
jgi:hypothetical protein